MGARMRARFSIFGFWVWRMAWRDARRNFSRVFLFVASMAVGVAAMVSVNSISYLLQEELDQNAKSLLGADFVVEGSHPFDAELLALFDSLPVRYIQGAETMSMVFFPGRHESQLVRVVALDEAYPLHGTFTTEPVDARGRMQRAGYALVDGAIKERYGLAAVDSIKVGERYLGFAGVVTGSSAAGGFSQLYLPSVYVSPSDLAATGLLQYGSRVTYRCFFRLLPDGQLNSVVAQVRPTLVARGYTCRTVSDQRESSGRAFGRAESFFGLLAFLSLILGCVGVVSSLYAYARQKSNSAAILRCVGATGGQVFAIFFVQLFVAGVVSSGLGVALGALIQYVVFPVLQSYAPILFFQHRLVVSVLLEGFVVGVLGSALFALLPLYTLRSIPSLRVMRGDASSPGFLRRGYWDVFLVFAVVSFLPLVAWYQTQNGVYALVFSVGVALVCLFLMVAARGCMEWLRRCMPAGAGFLFRQALSNLSRPNNQTRVLTVVLGMSVFIFITLHGVQHSLLSQSDFVAQDNRVNVLLFDIQPSQREGVLSVLQRHKVSFDRAVPIVTCRLQQVNAVPVDDLLQDSTIEVPSWALTREYRVTYRDTLQDSEQLLEGRVQRLVGGRVEVTLSEDMMKTLDVSLGDSLVFDVQGVPLQVFLGGVRRVQWPKNPPNFIVVFPRRALELAPQTWVATALVNDSRQLNALEEGLAMDFSNVSVLDLRRVLETVNTLLGRVGLAIRFLAFFTLGVGLLVLLTSVANSRYARAEENALLRTVGATNCQLALIALMEYAYLGAFSAFSGLILAIPAAWGLAYWVFRVPFSCDPWVMFVTFLGVVLAIVFVGQLNLRGLLSVSPLRVLRREE